MQRKDIGYFTNDGREYVITEVDTKLPCVNYLWNDRFISGVSQHMAGIGCFTERPMQYMDPFCRALMIRDENRHFYIRDDETGEIWSPGWYPVLGTLDQYKCRHGLGYSVLESSLGGIKTVMRIFVPSDEPVEIWTITLTNTGAATRKIKFYSFIDWLLKGYPEYCDYYSNLYSQYNDEKHILVCYNKTPERTHDFFNGFVASDLAPSGFDSSKKAFMGYSQINRPRAIVDGKCTNSIGVCEDLVGVLEHTLILKQNEKKTFNVIMGATDSMLSAERIAVKYFYCNNIEREFQAIANNIEDSYSSVWFNTPEDKINFLFNNWIKRSVQLHTEVGTDTGRGLRDVLQAAWAVSIYDHAGAKQKIIDCLKHQFSDGHTLRGWNPVDDHHYSDGPVWIAPAVDAYLKETGDYSFIEEIVPYFDRGEGSVLEHILAGIRNACNDIGPHGLVKIHYGDWNDSLNMMGKEGKGESNWTSIGIIFSIDRAIDIIEHVLGDKSLTDELQYYRNKLCKAVNDAGWDGEWYIEGYNDKGDKVGSHLNKEGRVYLNPQTWAIMAGIVPPERLKCILNVIDNVLESDYGSLVLTPTYRTPDPNIGRLTYFIPGMWENASAYCHSTAFKIMADTYMKRGDVAYRSIMKILPDSESNPSSYSGVPPYMVTNMYYGPEHPRKGQILYYWITGTADWLFKAMTDNIIGVKATYDGLIIDPCVPRHWDKFGIKREFRGAVYDVEFYNPDKKQYGLTSIEVDGKRVKGILLPNFSDGAIHKVKVVM